MSDLSRPRDVTGLTVGELERARRGMQASLALGRLGSPAGVPILAGTDANADPGVPAAISHGSSLHHELELLVDAGLTTLDALRGATSRPARYFRLGHRGVIEPGRRADLASCLGDPISDPRPVAPPGR